MSGNQESLAATLKEIEREKGVIIGWPDKQTGTYDVGVLFSKLKKSGEIYEFYINYFIDIKGTNIFFPGNLESEAFRFSKTTIPSIRQKIENEFDIYGILHPENTPEDSDKSCTPVFHKLESPDTEPKYSHTLFQLANRTVRAVWMDHRRGY